VARGDKVHFMATAITYRTGSNPICGAAKRIACSGRRPNARQHPEGGTIPSYRDFASTRMAGDRSVDC